MAVYSLQLFIIDCMSNVERFTGKATTYDRYRQRYPSMEIITTLNRWCNLNPSSIVADVGAGTGMLSEVFLQAGNPVIAIEPNQQMRAICSKLIQHRNALRVLDGTAEATGLAAESVDMVAAGRAFHWFDTKAALAEFRRILKPGGWLAIVSIGRAKDDSAQCNDFEALLLNYGTDFNYVRAGYRVHENLQDIFISDAHDKQIHSEQHLHWEHFWGQVMSMSVVPNPGDPRFPGFERALRSHFDTFATDGILTLPSTCWMNAGRI